tara:strand:+ start:2949 stop:3269 length:321 start_codon:yes stop_codon:yes gene_type:complete
MSDGEGTTIGGNTTTSLRNFAVALAAVAACTAWMYRVEDALSDMATEQGRMADSNERFQNAMIAYVHETITKSEVRYLFEAASQRNDGWLPPPPLPKSPYPVERQK